MAAANLGLLALLATLSGLSQPASSPAALEGGALVRQHCAVCHNLDRVKGHLGENDEAAWLAYISRMQQKGSRISDQEKAVAAKFLAGLKPGDGL